jgi:hypothetical protein
VRTKTGLTHLKLQLEDSETEELDVNTYKMTSMHGLVVDGDGEPIANAQCNSRSSSWSSSEHRDPTQQGLPR